MELYQSKFYMEDVDNVARLNLPWGKLTGKGILVSGATGLIGSFLVDVLMELSRGGIDCSVYALARDERRARERFSRWKNDEHLRIVPFDVNEPLRSDAIGDVGYVCHLASNTHPMQYSTDPIGTITTNVLGLRNMLEFAYESNAERVVFASSNEVYGENHGDVELFDEDYCGYINSNTLRAGYPESKRCGEALCQAYRTQKGLDIVIPRLTRSYGPTMLMADSKALSQFIKKAVSGEDIVLKSAGNQYYSYTYVADAVSGLLTVMLLGNDGEAYNVADEKSDVKLCDLAEMVASCSGRKVVHEAPDETEAKGYSLATKARLSSKKLQTLGWRARYDIRSGISRTVSILSTAENRGNHVSV